MAYNPPLPELTGEEELDCGNESRNAGVPLWIPRIIKRQDKEIERLRAENEDLRELVERLGHDPDQGLQWLAETKKRAR
jgi:hypothetical protein